MQSQRRHHLRRRHSELLALLIAALIGCSSPRGSGAKPQAATTSPADVTSAADACAQRLHDLSGGLLLYYFANHKLPANLRGVELPGGVATAEALVCPVSNQPYVYDPRGLAAPDHKSRLIVYDSIPHGGRRWAISFNDTDPALPQTEVLAVPESYFAAP